MISNELLKKKILDEAIHGKLVENDCNLKKSEVKENPEIALFDIPANWLWTELNNACQLSNSEKVKDVNLPYLDVKYLRTRGEKVFKNSGAILNCGDYIILVDGENSGEVFIAPEKGIMGSTFKKLLFNDKINNKYIRLLLKYYQETLKNNKTGSAIPHLNKKMFSWLPVPIPPIEEQERIVKKIEKLFELIDKKEKKDKEKEKLKTLLKEKILDRAIHGELVENDLSLPIVDVEEVKENVPFEIPNNWKWSKLGRISDYGKNKKVKGINISKDEWILELEDIEKNTGKILNKIYQADRNAISDKNIFFKGNLLYGKLRPYLNKCVIADEDGFCCTEIEPIILNSNIEAKYIQRVLMSKYFLNYVTSCSYGAKMPRLGTKDAKNAMIPIPPLEQQKKIVEKIEKCFELIEQL